MMTRIKKTKIGESRPPKPAVKPNLQTTIVKLSSLEPTVSKPKEESNQNKNK